MEVGAEKRRWAGNTKWIFHLMGGGAVVSKRGGLY